MAGHYRIEISHRQDVGQSAAGGNAVPSFVAGAGRVWSDTPVIPIDTHGCVIGHLFSRTDPSRRITEFAADEVLAIRASGGRSLLGDFWGAYVAVLTGVDGSVSVLRDPSAQMPCYYRSEAGYLALASDVTQLAQRGHQAVNFIEIGKLLASVDAIGRETCISGVMELLPGECITTTPGGHTISEWWSPWPWTAPERPLSFENNASRLRRVLLDCMGSWASCFKSVALGVSGGLDSSIVACATHPQALELHCLNIVSSGSGGDERGYASVLASALGRPLHERHYSLSSIDIEKPVAPHHAWPNAPYFMQGIAAIHSGFSSEHHIDAYFSGNGGDNVFCSLATAAPFVDRFLTQGARSGVMNTLRDLSLLTGADGMTILRHALGIYRRVGSPTRINLNRSGLSSSFIEALEPFRPLHPWLEDTKGALPGKIGHVKQIIRAHRGIELYPRAESPLHIAPLLSQPIIELCLGIPTWHWVQEGINRAVAREAVRGIVPQQLLRRTSKGGPSGFMAEIFQANRQKAAQMLRDGLLARAGLLDLSIFEGINPVTASGSDKARRILDLCAAEAWARWWSDAI